MAAAVERAMAKNPEDRFASAVEMSAALRAGAQPPTDVTDAPTVLAATSMAPVQAPSLDRRSERRRIGALVTVAGLAVAGLAVALIVAAAGGDNPEAPAEETPAVTATVTSTVTSTVTGPPTTLLTPTSTATTRTTGGGGKGKGKEKE